MTALATLIATQVQRGCRLPMLYLCAVRGCLGFAPAPRSLCHNCLMEERAANDAELAREWAHLMGW